MIRTLFYTEDGKITTQPSVDLLSTYLADPKGLLWVDLCAEPPDQCESILEDIFKFHPLAVQDALDQTHIPKMDDWRDYVYTVLHIAVITDPESLTVDTLEMDCFIGANYLVTYTVKPIEATSKLWSLLTNHQHPEIRGAAHFLYLLADVIVADFLDVFKVIDDEIDTMQDRVFSDPSVNLVEHIFTMKRSVLRLRRIVGPQREVFNRLSRGDGVIIPQPERIYFRDIYDHFARMYELTESLRELVGGALDMYLSVVNNRMNRVMKTLTLITTLFMPLSFFAGFFGMNFFRPTVDLDGWTGYLVFGLTLTVMILLPVLMYAWMRKQAWD